jgi:hypothetical protein
LLYTSSAGGKIVESHHFPALRQDRASGKTW